MAKIHILDSETIDKIAAGEVVERPSSVVKELVENAIDAGATAITVEVKDGGIELIRVTDNGCGMEKEQLRTAFLRHATSKIENVNDLLRISSLGFRGEALSSIAAVARVEVATKVSGCMTGSRILLEGANEVSFDEVGVPEGTTFIVRNLFFNTPVRRKFLKQPVTEGGYIAALMEHLALSRPDVSFKFLLGNQTKFHTSGNGDLREVIYRIYGREVAGALIPIQAKREGMCIEGYLGKPVQVRSNRNFEIYFINGRFIRSNVVSKAVEEGYKEYLMQHKFPLCVLHITMDTACVDVNVHPTKMDVRFSDTIGFCGFVTETVKQTLRCQEMIPEASLSTEKELRAVRTAERKEKERKDTPEPFESRRSSVYQVMEEAQYTKSQPKAQDFSHNPVWKRVKSHDFSEETSIVQDKIEVIQKEPDELHQKAAIVQEVPDDKYYATQDNHRETKAVDNDLNVIEKAEQILQEEDFFTETSEVAENRPSEENNTKNQENDLSPTPTGVQMNFFEDKILTMENRNRFRMIGQVFDTYWLIEFEEKLLMVDQHAAHEKVNYERLMKQYHEKVVVSQNLLPPVIVTLSGQEEMVLKEHREVFEALGFEIEDFGGSEYALRSVPVDLYGCDEKEMFLEVLEGLANGSTLKSTESGNLRVIEEKIASMSCKAAVKGNNRLSFAEAEALIDELLTLDNPYHCPHGRPTIVAMTKTEMDRKFKRIVS
ncbi:MAG: DNA mismatch repair endonuclease MutL [Lachnospiraceae bacterium]|nr:DNA mismatch repair endonuclease MutL [Lachnospiraceae bacterium]